MTTFKKKYKTEGEFQQDLKKRLRETYPIKAGGVVLKNDPNDIQGIADLGIGYKGTCAYLEAKKDKGASHRPNQDWYVNQINSTGGFARFIYPENAEEVLKEMEEYFNGV